MKKFCLIIVSNFLIFCFLIFLAEVIIWQCENKRLENQKDVYYMTFGKIKFHPEIKPPQINLNMFFDDNNKYVRKPVGLNYKKKSVVIFGCSFAYGFMLDDKDTFSYKLSRLTHRPVYNRASTAWGVQHMLKQVRDEEFYKTVPEPDYVIYLFIYDHFRRLYVLSFMSGDMLRDILYLRYKDKNGRLEEINYNNDLLNHLKCLYIVQKFHHFIVNNFIVNSKHIEKNFDFAVEHFSQSKEEMEKHWKNTKYYVLIYNDFVNVDIFKSKLEKSGFNVIKLKDLSGINLESEEYQIDGNHPNAKAWELLTPMVIKEIGIN